MAELKLVERIHDRDGRLFVKPVDEAPYVMALGKVDPHFREYAHAVDVVGVEHTDGVLSGMYHMNRKIFPV
ncbi:MAG: hypothetical protein HY367_01760 [Candidatus Aenigmarchaeota archaeon]|nr:hypothetical protein [Candidatus Aenigmarchaeota archaeon]